ncbi:GNAT family N-acetyltransferase [Bacillus sp. UNC41MFS5]|uniref:GNAT family N-acetyltransferase n=1 Tax=Bacillus sp. UNC41MFS5 TaxID=1449046 RepID=UPI00047A3FE1|nr:GNAT family N-acetyltransferase [Bacillus sp. UNC41MFS5]
MENNEIEISEGNLSELHNVYQLLQADFPANELKDYKHFQLLLANEKYKLIWAKQQEEIVGYALIYEFDHLPAIWLDYIAIDQQFRNAGYGSLFFQKILQSKQDGFIGIFVEVEIPEEDGDTREQQLRRINFYERLGARRLKIPYILPTNDGGFPMYLYFRPSSNVHRLPEEQIEAAIQEAFQFIHSDVIDKDTILNEFSTFIGDEYFS